jgi:hypothetical protein
MSKQSDAMARHYLYEAANVLLTTAKKRFALRSWDLKLMRKLGPKRARVAVARKLAVLLGRMWKDAAHFDAVVVAWDEKKLGDEEEVLRFGAFPGPFRNEAGVDQKGERATRWLQIQSLRLIHCAARLVSASVGQDCWRQAHAGRRKEPLKWANSKDAETQKILDAAA